MSVPQTVTILGATGSIGVSALDVIAQHPQRFRVLGLSAHHNLERLLEQCLQFRPRRVVVAAGHAQQFRVMARAAGVEAAVESGPDALVELAADPDSATLVAAIVGAAGLAPTLAAVRAGKRILLANKESLVSAGALFMDAVRASGATLLPLDSEHNAIFQCLPTHPPTQSAGRAEGVRRILLTASGGPFRTASRAMLEAVTPEQACAHPNWSMGRKISVDSATLMNKGLELIEACWLFGLTSSEVDVVVHPQSVVHSLVEYVDGSLLAQLGSPDMRIPIAHALGHPDRIDSGASVLDLVAVARLDFEPPDVQRFPCLALARAAFEAGGDSSARMNAANEVAVAAFLDDRIGFMDIPRIVESVMVASGSPVASLEDVLAADRMARHDAELVIRQMAKR